MAKLPVRNLFKVDLDEILDLRADLTLVFEDGVEIEANWKEIILYRFLMDFIKDLPPIELTSDLWLSNFYESGYFNSGTYTGLYTAIVRKFKEKYIYPNNDNDLLEHILKGMYESVNMIAKKLSKLLGNYVVGIEIPDVLEIQMNEKLLRSIVEVNNTPTQEKIENTYKTLDDVIKEAPDDSIIKLIYLSKMISISQIQQLFGSRGFLTEINSKIFALPMTNSFTLGCKNIYELAIESRAGAKALYLSSKAIQDSEYMARELQLVTMIIERLEFGDCGSKNYMDFFVEPRKIDPITGKEIYKGDLRNLVGKWYLDEETGEEKLITKDSTHLEGKHIKLRTVLGCNLRDKKKVCSKCFGELAYNIFKHQNLGHITTTNTTKPISQSIISTKHLTKSASSGTVELDDTAKKYFMVKDKNKLFFYSKWLNKKTKKIKLHVPQEQAFGLKSVIDTKDVLKVNLRKASRLYEVVIEETGKIPNYDVVKLKSGNRFGYFTTYFWDYVIKNGYQIDEFDNYEIDLSDWDSKYPIIQYEKVEFDFAALSKEFKNIIKKRKYYKQNGRIRSEFTPDVLVGKLFELVNKKLDINIALLETIVYGFTAYDITNDNYDIGRNSPYDDVVGIKPAIDFRSIGGSYDWDALTNKILDPVSHKDKDKPDHPLDVLFRPNEVLERVGKD